MSGTMCCCVFGLTLLTEDGGVVHVHGKGNKDRRIRVEQALIDEIEVYLDSRAARFPPAPMAGGQPADLAPGRPPPRCSSVSALDATAESTRRCSKPASSFCVMLSWPETNVVAIVDLFDRGRPSTAAGPTGRSPGVGVIAAIAEFDVQETRETATPPTSDPSQ